MDTVTESAMAQAMGEAGAVGALHRFCTIEENIVMFKKSISRRPIVSLGVGKQDLERAEALYAEGCRNFVIDVAHGAAMHVVRTYDDLRKLLGRDVEIMIGNFATAKGIEDFRFYVKTAKPTIFKVGIGGGSMCTTRIVTGCGMPTLASVLDCAKIPNIQIVADGGMRTSGDIAKALAAGATAVMLGGMLAGADETPGEFFSKIWEGIGNVPGPKIYKNYRGSASAASYEAQGKIAGHRSPEGESTTVKCKGPVKNVLKQISGGLRSALSYTGSSNLNQFRINGHLVQITNAGQRENEAHGK